MLSMPFARQKVLVYPPLLRVELVSPHVERSSDHIPMPKDESRERAEADRFAASPSPIVELTPIPKRKETPQPLSAPTIFLPTSALSVKPRLLNPEWMDVAERFPPQAGGMVSVQIDIDKHGRVVAAHVDGPPSEFADWISEELPTRARFSPGERDGVPVASTIRVRLSLDRLMR